MILTLLSLVGMNQFFRSSVCSSGGEAPLGVGMANFLERDLARLEVLVVLEGVVAGRIVVVRRALALSKAGVLLAHLLLIAHHVIEVEVREDTVVGNAVVRVGRLVVVEMREASTVRSTKIGRHVLVAIVDSVTLLTMEVLENVMLYDGVLVDGASVGTGGLARDAVTDGEDVLKAVMLESVAVNIDHTLRVAHTRVEEELVLTARWVDVGANEVLLDRFTGVDVLEGCDLGLGILTDAQELPSEMDLNAALGTLVKSNFVGVREGIDELVWCPVLDLGTGRCGAEQLVLADDGLVVEGVEVGTFALVWSKRRVGDHITATLHPSIIEVACQSIL